MSEQVIRYLYEQENVYGRTDVLMYWRTHVPMPDFPPVR